MAVGVKLKGGKEVRASQAVVCNASIWDSAQLLPKGDSAFDTIKEDWTDTPMTRSYLHLHLGIDATGLDLSKLEPHYTAMEHWDDVTAEQNMVAISNPSLLDKSLCPPGKLILHLYGAGNEPFDIWKDVEADGKGPYKALKESRAERLWTALEEIIPDARARTEVQMVGSPLTHRRYLTRAAGTYGPAPVFGRFGPGKLPFRTAMDASAGRGEDGIEGLILCGDSTFPGIGVPAAVVSGLSAAHSAMSPWEHLELLGKAGY
jgi:phytoene dehydrogenase-like protein